MHYIKDWLEQNNGFGLILPDGYFGRPRDNYHQMTWIAERENKLIIELDNQLYLTFTKPVSHSTQGSDLILSSFSQLVFDRQGYGDLTPHCVIYKNGEVKFEVF